MLYALLDSSPIIEIYHLRAALALWFYCDDSARVIFGSDDANWLERKIVRVVNEHPQGVLRSSLCNAVCKKTLATEYDSVFAKLIADGVIVQDDEQRGTRFYPCGGTGERGNFPVDDSATSPVPRSPDTSHERTSPVPRSPDIVDDDETIALADTEFYDELTGNVTPATLTELLDWRNANGVRFRRMADSSIWVTTAYDTLVTPTLSAAIHANQETLSLFVSDDDNGELSDDEIETFWEHRPTTPVDDDDGVIRNEVGIVVQ